jgi:uncharacterized membrane protein
MARLQRKSGSILIKPPISKKNHFWGRLRQSVKKKPYASGEIDTEEFDRKKKDLE